MGIRVHKLLGYGIDDLKVIPESSKKHALDIPDDPRWDYARYLGDWQEQERDLKEFISWCEDQENAQRVISLANRDKWGFHKEARRPFNESVEWKLMLLALKESEDKRMWCAPYSAVRWDPEYGLSNVVLFQCPEHPDWLRYDDIMDYYEESDPVDGRRRRATLLPMSSGIWPYDGTMIRFRDMSCELEEALKDIPRRESGFGIKAGFLRAKEYFILLGNSSPDQEPLVKEPLLSHLRNDWRPRIPISIIAVMEFMGCFPDLGPDSMFNSLRPMIYVYWS